MDFVYVMKDWRRMCQAYGNRCDLCPLTNYECGAVPRNMKHYTDKQVEEIIVSWAAEYPEPVYPTWREYLTSIGVIPEAVILATEKDEFNTFWRWDEACALTNKRIPAEIAEKLGIEPKEG